MNKPKHPMGIHKPAHPMGHKPPAHPLDHGSSKCAPKKPMPPPQLPAALAPAPANSQNPGVFNA